MNMKDFTTYDNVFENHVHKFLETPPIHSHYTKTTLTHVKRLKNKIGWMWVGFKRVIYSRLIDKTDADPGTSIIYRCAGDAV